MKIAARRMRMPKSERGLAVVGMFGRYGRMGARVQMFSLPHMKLCRQTAGLRAAESRGRLSPHGLTCFLPAQVVQVLVTLRDAVEGVCCLVVFDDVVLDSRLAGLGEDALPVDEAVAD